MGLSDKVQSLLVVVSSVLIAIGSIQTASTLNDPYFGIIIVILGAIGFGIKESFGIKEKTSNTTPPS